MSQLNLFLFGAPRLERDGEPVNISLRKALALLAYLATTKQSHSRDALATLFWPDDDQSKARGNLRRALSRINTALGKGWLETNREHAGLNPKADLWLDVDHFQHHLAQCETHGHPSNDVCTDCLPLLTEAISSYTDDFLAGFTLPDCPDFDEWQFFQSESLRQALASALERLVQGLRDQSGYELAIPHARHWLALDPLHEPAHQQLMQLYAKSGQHAAALRQYQECVRILDEELGISPSEETIALYETIKTKRFSPTSEAEEKSLLAPRSPAPLHNLPPQPTPFIGREAELAALDDLITNPDVRSITIVGSGGMGKTRLALASAERQLETGRFPNGVYFVSLAPLNSVDHIIPTVAEALSFPLQGSGRSPRQQILDYLRQKRMLMVMDNFEHLLDGVDLVVDVLQVAPEVQILATSRERLQLHEEQVYPIQGFELLDLETVEDAVEAPVVRLFLQSAQRVQPDFELEADNLTNLAHICRLVEGLPLGLELAASWVDMLSLADIAAEIQQSLDFLETEMRNIPERHRSMRAVFDTTWQRLSETEQDVFAQLSVFRGGFTRKAAQEVTGASLRLLATLGNKSLLRYNQSRDRYEIHELLRQYGTEKLTESGETEQTQDRHLAFFLKLAEEAELHLEGSDRVIWLNRLEIEHDNLRVAVSWSQTVEDKAELNLRLTGSLAQFWNFYGYYSEGRKHLSIALSNTKASQSTATRAKVLYETARLVYEQGDYSTTRTLLEESLSIYVKLGPVGQLGHAHALRTLGITELAVGDYTVASSLLKEALDIMRTLNDQRGVAKALWQLGWCAMRPGDYDQASHYFAEALPLWRQIGDRGELATVLSGMGELALRQKDYEHATALLKESLALRREEHHKWGIAASLGTLGWVALRQGDLKQAITLLVESLTLRREMGDAGGIAWCLEKLAEVALTKDQKESSARRDRNFRRAAQLFGAAEALRTPAGSVIDLADQPEYERQVALVQARLGDATFTATWTEGQALDPREMATELLEALTKQGWGEPPD